MPWPRLSGIAAAVGLSLLALLVLAAWPRSADTAPERSYDRLGASPVPVLLPYTPGLDPSAGRLEPDGYVLPLQDTDAGPLTMAGRRATAADAAPPPNEALRVRGAPAHVVTHPADGGSGAGTTEIRWREGDAAYTLSFQSAPDPERVARLARRVVTLEEARRASLGDRNDTPLLYLLYLPLFTAFGAWALVSLLGNSRHGRASVLVEDTPVAG